MPEINARSAIAPHPSRVGFLHIGRVSDALVCFRVIGGGARWTSYLGGRVGESDGVRHAMLTGQVTEHVVFRSGLDLLQYSLALAAMSATVGSIVVVFIFFGIQELAAKRAQRHDTPTLQYRYMRELGRTELLMRTAAIAMAVLLATALFVLLGITARPTKLEHVAVIATGTFTFSVGAILLALLAYFVVERATERAEQFGPSHLTTQSSDETAPAG
jgi:hypothetical protein